MISTLWTDAPAGFSGPGSLGVSCSAHPTALAGGTGVVMAATAAPIQGTGVPIAIRLRATNDNSTTLGIHPSGRPLS